MTDGYHALGPQELHELALAMGDHRGFDVCGRSARGERPDGAAEVHLLHELAMSRGAYCSGGVDDDEDPGGDEVEFADGLPGLADEESAEIDRASRVSPADLDAAGELWKRHAGELSGLWDAGSPGAK